MGIFSLLLVAYIIGSFPIGLWVGQFFFKKDIRAQGSGNTGATNAYRILGPLAGIIVFTGDFLKGAAPVVIMKYSIKASSVYLPWLIVATGILTILGHTFSIFLKFRGGKGAATAVGVILVLSPITLLIITLIWIGTLAITKYVSVSSMVSAIAFPIIFLVLEVDLPYVLFSFLVCVLIIYKHRSNINRLIKGTELKVGK